MTLAITAGQLPALVWGGAMFAVVIVGIAADAQRHFTRWLRERHVRREVK